MKIFRSLFINNTSTMHRTENIQPLGPNGISLESWSETKVKSHNTNHLWIIQDYAFHQGNLPKTGSLTSPSFSAATYKQCKWRLKIYPNGSKHSNITKKNDFSLFLQLDPTSECTAALAKFKLSVLKENNKVELCRSTGLACKFKTDTDGNNGRGWAEFIHNDYELLPDNKLIIYCEMKIFESDNITNTINYSHSTDSNVAEVRPSENPRQIFHEEYSDVIISVKGKDYKVYTSVLSSRSPVFAAMFKQNDMKENQQNKVVIDDFDEPIVEEMLKYIYTGRSENLNETADKLLAIAEKYGLNELKELCEETLTKNLSAQNAIDVLVMADLHHANKLRANALNFIVEKLAQDRETSPCWENFAASHPQLAIEVCQNFFRQKFNALENKLLL